MIDVAGSTAHLLEAGTRRLRAEGVEQPGREVRWIWERISGQARIQQLTGDLLPVPEALATRFMHAIERRARGEPLAHVLNEAPFRHLTLHSDRRALIPRPETEGLVELVLERRQTGIVADVGTGTGCIALSLASEGKFDLVIAVERSPDALALARTNVESLKSPVRLIHGDLGECLGNARLDVLVSNPPYLTEEEYAGLSPSVRHWEPAAALQSGTDGLNATGRLLVDGLRVVKPGGWIILEVDCTRAEQVAAHAVCAGWSDVLVKDDLFGRARYLVARRSE